MLQSHFGGDVKKLVVVCGLEDFFWRWCSFCQGVSSAVLPFFFDSRKNVVIDPFGDFRIQQSQAGSGKSGSGGATQLGG